MTVSEISYFYMEFLVYDLLIGFVEVFHLDFIIFSRINFFTEENRQFIK